MPIQIIEPTGERQATKNQVADAESKPSTVPTQILAQLPTKPKPNVTEELMTPISSRPLDASVKPSTIPPSSPAPSKPPVSSFAEAKQAREGARPSLVGGGVFRANGRNTIFPSNDKTSATPPVSVPPPPQTPNKEIRTPESSRTGSVMYPVNILGALSSMTMFNFNKAWEADRSVEQRWKLITVRRFFTMVTSPCSVQLAQSIPPASIPSMCKSSLDPALLISIIDVFIDVMKANGSDQATANVIRAYLMEFENVPRFGTVLLFLSEKEKARIVEIWKLLGVETLSGVWSSLAR